METYATAPWLEKLSDVSTEKNYQTGDAVTIQGETLSTIGIITSGRAAIIAYSINGEQTWVGELTEGQFIGTISLFDYETSRFEITAITKLVVLTTTKTKFINLLQNDNTLCETVAEDLALRLRGTMSNLVDVHTLSVKARICTEILRLAIPIGIDPDRHIIRPSPTYVELARRLNSTRETISRAMSDLQKRGILSREPGALIIRDPDQLRHVVNHI